MSDRWPMMGQHGRGINESSEPMTGIEPALQPWEGRILPLNYIDIDRGREEKDGETPRPPTRDTHLWGWSVAFTGWCPREPATGIEPAL
jgi:hypothetical protein